MPTLVRSSLAAAGVLVTILGQAAPPTPSAAPSAAAAPAASAAPAAPPGCPDMTIETKGRTIDTRKSNGDPPAVYRKRVWAKPHTKPPVAADFLDAKAAVDAVVAAEKKTPKMIPEGFRAEVLAAPTDAALRVKMAKCEEQVDVTRRRAAYDYGMAILLGGGGPEAIAALKKLVPTFGRWTSTCGFSACDAGEVCEAGRKECIAPRDKIAAMASKEELVVEDALTRGLLKSFFKFKPEKTLDDDDPSGAAIFWAVTMRHACDGKMCLYSRYQVGGDVSWVHWDTRDGGTSEEIPLTPAQKAENARKGREKCITRTGFASIGACRSGCRGFGCLANCEMYCQDAP